MVKKNNSKPAKNKRKGNYCSSPLPIMSIYNERRSLWHLPIGIKAPVKRFTKEEIAEYEANLAKK